MKAGDEMFSALRGVTGVAAMTNNSYEDIGRIFTQVAGQEMRLMGDPASSAICQRHERSCNIVEII